MNRRDFLLRSGAAISLSLLAKGPLSAQIPSTSSGPVALPPATQFNSSPRRSNLGVASDELTSA